MNHQNHQSQPGLYFPASNACIQMTPQPVQNFSDPIRPHGPATAYVLPNNCLGLSNIQWTQLGVQTVPTCPNTSNFLPPYICNLPNPNCFIPYFCPAPVAPCCNFKETPTQNAPAASSQSCSCGVDQDRRFPSENVGKSCSNVECPSALRLQALASQLLSINGVISCAINRLISKKLPKSNVNTSEEQVMAQARECISALNKEQLVEELKNAQQINALITLHVSVKSSSNLLPTLTSLQLQTNVLKAHVEELISQKKMVCDEGRNSGVLDERVLSLKSDEEVREMLAALRQKEYDLNISFSFSPHQYQRVESENLLKCTKKLIEQVENEMIKRRRQELGSSGQSRTCGKRYFDAFYQ